MAEVTTGATGTQNVGSGRAVSPLSRGRRKKKKVEYYWPSPIKRPKKRRRR